MGIKNYSTKITAVQTVSEIEFILVRHGATDLWKQYDRAGKITSLTFAVITEQGKIPFRLYINIEAVRHILAEQHKNGKGKGISLPQSVDIEHARNVGWRILKDMLDAQMAMIEVGGRKLEQIFLADIWDVQSGKTFFEVIQEKKFAGMLMEGTKT